jgi:hypothetical protein
MERAEKVETLEGPEEVPAGAYLCRGEAGDIWPQSEESISARYVPTEEIEVGGWRKWTPRPDAAGVMAAQVPRAFEVQTAWGLLSGKPGDYVVKNHEDRDSDDPPDLWIVDQRLFEATYERLSP